MAVGVAVGSDTVVRVGVCVGCGVAVALGVAVAVGVAVGGGVSVAVAVDVATGNSATRATSVSVAVGATDIPSATSVTKTGTKAVLMTSPTKLREDEPVARTGEEYSSDARVSRRAWRLALLVLMATVGITAASIAAVAWQPDVRRASPVWSDDFDQDAGDWQIDPGGGEITEGRLVLYPPAADTSARAIHTLPVSDFVLETRASVTRGPADNGYGIALGSPDRLTAFLISGDGYMSVMRCEAGRCFDVQTWRPWPHVRRGAASNTLRLECREACSFYVNEELTAQIEVERPRTLVGLMAMRYLPEPLTVAFDFVKVWAY